MSPTKYHLSLVKPEDRGLAAETLSCLQPRDIQIYKSVFMPDSIWCAASWVIMYLESANVDCMRLQTRVISEEIMTLFKLNSDYDKELEVLKNLHATNELLSSESCTF